MDYDPVCGRLSDNGLLFLRAILCALFAGGSGPRYHSNKIAIFEDCS